MSNNRDRLGEDLPLSISIVELPCQIVERMERYARENGVPVNGVLIDLSSKGLSDALAEVN